MKTENPNRDAVISRQHSICIASSKEYKTKVEKKAAELGVSLSALARMALNEFMKNH